jgi:hypothetical protein
VGTVVSSDAAGVVDVPAEVPVPGADAGGDVLLNVHPAVARAPQRTTSITSMTLNCMVKNASPAYIMLVLAQADRKIGEDIQPETRYIPHSFCIRQNYYQPIA